MKRKTKYNFPVKSVIASRSRSVKPNESVVSNSPVRSDKSSSCQKIEHITSGLNKVASPPHPVKGVGEENQVEKKGRGREEGRREGEGKKGWGEGSEWKKGKNLGKRKREGKSS